jgi:AcrR family transcriptional regulator
MLETKTDVKDGGTRERIIAAATDLFLQKGYASTSVEDILDAVQIAKGTFYHHFSSKGSLLESVTENFSQIGFQMVMEQFKQARLTSSVAKINLLFRLSLEWKEENTEAMLMLMESLHHESNLALVHSFRLKSRKLNIPIFLEIIREGNLSGEFRSEDPYFTAELLILLMEGLSEHLKDDILADSNLAMQARTEYQFAVERLLGVPKGSLRLVDWVSYQSLKDKIRKIQLAKNSKMEIPEPAVALS